MSDTFRLSPAPPPTSGTALVQPPPGGPDPAAELGWTRAQDAMFQLSPRAPDVRDAVAPVADAPLPAGLTAAPGTLVLSPPPPDVVNQPAPTGDAALVATAALDELDLPSHLHDPAYSQEPVATPVTFPGPVPRLPVALSNEEAFRIAMAVAPAWSGADQWSALVLDEEFTFPALPAGARRHLGVGFGLLLFTQDSGLLGQVLRLFQQRDPQAFLDTLGPDPSLLPTVTAATSVARLSPVAGSALWEGEWPGRLRAAAATAPCTFAQNEVAVELVVRPAAVAALQLGLDTDRGVAMATDLVVSAGYGGGLRALVELAAPFASGDQLGLALAGLGYADLPALQAAADVPRTNVWDPATVVALVAARRAAGLDASGSLEVQARMISRSTGARQRRLLALRSSSALDDRGLTAAAG